MDSKFSLVPSFQIGRANSYAPRILIKYRQPDKKRAFWRFEQSTIWENRVKWESESLKLPTALDYQAAYFYILAVYVKT